MSAADPPTAVAAAVADAHRREWAFVLAATVRVAGDLDLAEECVQDAYAQRPRRLAERASRPPRRAWLTTAARATARSTSCAARRPLQRKLPLLVEPARTRTTRWRDDFPDDRLRLIFTCCHPALAVEAQIALTLRLVCGLSTAGDRPGRSWSASRRWRRGSPGPRRRSPRRGIPYRVPAADELPERVDAVLHGRPPALHGRAHRPRRATAWSAPSSSSGARPRPHAPALLPDDADVAGLLALILLTDAPARRPASTPRAAAAARRTRTGAVGPRGDRGGHRAGARAPWAVRAAGPLRAAGGDRGGARRGPALGRHGLARDRRRCTTCCCSVWPSPVVALNRAVAIGFAEGPQAGLDAARRARGRPALARYAYLAGRPRRPPRAAGAGGGGAAGLRRGARLHGERRGARLPRRAEGPARRLSGPGRTPVDALADAAAPRRSTDALLSGGSREGPGGVRGRCQHPGRATGLRRDRLRDGGSLRRVRLLRRGGRGGGRTGRRPGRLADPAARRARRVQRVEHPDPRHHAGPRGRRGGLGRPARRPDGGHRRPARRRPQRPLRHGRPARRVLRLRRRHAADRLLLQPRASPAAPTR